MSIADFQDINIKSKLVYKRKWRRTCVNIILVSRPTICLIIALPTTCLMKFLNEVTSLMLKKRPIFYQHMRYHILFLMQSISFRKNNPHHCGLLIWVCTCSSSSTRGSKSYVQNSLLPTPSIEFESEPCAIYLG